MIVVVSCNKVFLEPTDLYSIYISIYYECKHYCIFLKVHVIASPPKIKKNAWILVWNGISWSVMFLNFEYDNFLYIRNLSFILLASL